MTVSKFIAFVLFSIFFVACDSNTEAWRVVLEEPVGDIAKALCEAATPNEPLKAGHCEEMV